jgi:hypothetical protein
LISLVKLGISSRKLRARGRVHFRLRLRADMRWESENGDNDRRAHHFMKIFSHQDGDLVISGFHTSRHTEFTENPQS